jgi:hypothetical protein
MADLAKSLKKIDFFGDHSQFIKNVYYTFLIPDQISVFSKIALISREAGNRDIRSSNDLFSFE